MIQETDPGFVVIVEDPSLWKFLDSVLTRAGHRTLEVGATEGVDLVRSGQVPVKAVITNKPEAFRAATNIPLIYTTSCPDPEAIREFHHCTVLQKPFDGSRLLHALEEVSASAVP